MEFNLVFEIYFFVISSSQVNLHVRTKCLFSKECCIDQSLSYTFVFRYVQREVQGYTIFQVLFLPPSQSLFALVRKGDCFYPVSYPCTSRIIEVL